MNYLNNKYIFYFKFRSIMNKHAGKKILVGGNFFKENIEKIVSRSGFTNSWDHILDYLESSLTHGSFELIRSSFLSEQNGILFFSDCLPDHLKVLLNNTVKNSRIIFEPDDKTNQTRTLVRQSRI